MVTSQCRFDESRFPFKEEQFTSAGVVTAPSVGVTPVPYGSMGGRSIVFDIKKINTPITELENVEEDQFVDLCSDSDDEDG